MKTTPRMSLSAALAAALLMGSVLHTQADWTRTGNTITDENGWALNVSAKTINGVAGISLNTDCVATKGTPADTLDLSGAVSDGSLIIEINNHALRTSKAGTLKSVTLPDTVIRIGESAFGSQTSLTNVTPFLPSSVKIIGSSAFHSVPVAGALDASSVTNLGSSAIRITKITSVTLGDPGLLSIPNHAFHSNPDLGSVVLPSSGLGSIGESAFGSCTALTNVTPLLPSSVTTVGSSTFSGSPIRGDLDLTSVTSLGGQSFRTTQIASVTFGPGVKMILSHTFNANSALGSVVFADGLETIQAEAFSSCGALSNIVNCLPFSLTSLASGQVNTFNSATYAGRVEILNPAFSIIPQQFGFKLAKDFVFGTGVTTVNSYGFDGVGSNSRAYDIYFRGGPPTFGTDVFRGTSDWKLRIFYPIYDDAVGGWRDWLATRSIPLTPAQRDAYIAAYPDAPLPSGRGNAGIFNGKYFVPWVDPAFGQHALHVVGNLTQNLAGYGEPARGTVDPAYGVVENLAEGSTVACSAPATAILNGTRYQCAGYVLETLGEEGWESPVTNLASTAFTYTQSGTAARRVTWLWEPIGYSIAFTMPDLGADSVTRSVQPDAEGIYPAGTVVQVTANASSAAPASVFRRWHGDVPEGQEPASATLTLTMDAPKALLPEFVRDWVYTAGTSATIRDGYWTLKVNGTTELEIRGDYKDSVLPFLDLAKPVSEGRKIIRILSTAFRIYSGNTSTYIESLLLPESMLEIQGRAFSGQTALTNIVPAFPKATVIGTQNGSAFDSVPYAGPVELLNPDITTVPAIFGNGGYYSAVFLGTGVTALADYAFDHNVTGTGATPWDLYFSGDVPTFGTAVIRNVEAGKLRVFLPKGREDWNAWRTANVVDLTPAEQEAYTLAHPDELLPVGRGKDGTVFAKQYIMLWTPPKDQIRTTVLVVR